MRITVVGAGYVGLVVATCLACGGHQVICLEKDRDRYKKLAAGQSPILEKNLPQMLTHALDSKKLCFTTRAAEAIPSAEIIFITVGTPSDKDGRADLSALSAAVLDVGRFLRNSKVIVLKSSVPPGTTEAVHNEILKMAMNTKSVDSLHVLYNPEFLREGTAIDDFLSPDRIIIGSDHQAASDMLLSLYRPLLRKPATEIITSPLNAELIKYASNSYLAIRLTFVNELAALCENLGASISEVTTAMGLDHRIGEEYLSAGLGYGGACLPKDTRALAYIAKEACAPLTVLESAIAANCSIARRLADMVVRYVPSGRIIAIWGLSFKAGTADIRNAPILSLIEAISKHLVCRFQIFDPASREFMVNCPKELLPFLCQSPEESLSGADALIVGTAWPQFRDFNLGQLLPHMLGRDVFDFVNVLDRTKVLQSGFVYHACGESERSLMRNAT